jgi:hypothetical protein
MEFSKKSAAVRLGAGLENVWDRLPLDAKEPVFASHSSALALALFSPAAYGTPTPLAPWDHPNLDPEIKTAPSGDEVVADLTSAKFHQE